jgi:hypothetical protein
MIRMERVMTDHTGKSFTVRIEIDEGGDRLDRAIVRLANKARGMKSGKASALDGAVRVAVEERR